MRIALLTESAFPAARSVEGGWCERLTRGLPEHEFELYALGATRRDPMPEPLPARLAALRHSGSTGGQSGRPAGSPLAGGLHGLRRRRALAAYRQLVAALAEPGEAEGFGPALYALAEAGARRVARAAPFGPGAHRGRERLAQPGGARHGRPRLGRRAPGPGRAGGGPAGALPAPCPPPGTAWTPSVRRICATPWTAVSGCSRAWSPNITTALRC
ncbi:DUF3492 domain-containing protein [Streptacidiphilus sp. 4-A2]|nr:DUF3492 domain-containing protein [Streptacidiphilus sp. 4-A2]